MSNPTSYSSSIKKLKTGFTKLSTSILYAPLLDRYYRFSEALERAQKDNELESYIKALDEFSHSEVKESIHDRTVEYTRSFLTDDTDFFDEHYPSLSHIAERHQPGSKLTQSLRKKILSFFQVLNKDISEMERERKKIEKGISEMDSSSTSRLVKGVRNAAIGASAASVVPVLGTAAGAAAGLFATDYMETQENNNKEEEVLKSINKYVIHVENIMEKLSQNAEEIYVIFENLGGVIYKRIPRKIYRDLEKEGQNADLIMKHYYSYYSSEMSEVFDKKIDEKNKESPTFRDLTSEVHEFIKSRDENR